MRILQNLIFPVLMGTASLASALELPAILSEDMVLQQQAEVKLWGWAEKGLTITAGASWTAETVNAQTGEDGRWTLRLKTPAASYDLHEVWITDGKDTLRRREVLVGEVWFCSGQSNMQMPLHGFWTQPIEGSNEVIAHARSYYNKIRMATVPTQDGLQPQEKVGGEWKQSTTETLPEFSAVGFFFAEELNRMLDVPIGIINCSWGGSCVEGWMPREVLETYADVDLSEKRLTKAGDYTRPLVMYNGMIAPIAGYTVRGFAWNQGESNVGRHDTYPARLGKMVEIWRQLWDDNNLPFYMVEIPPHDYGDSKATNAAFLREAQYKAAGEIPHAGIISTADLSKPHEADVIHPSVKKPIGQRLAWLAAVKTYGIKGVECESPTYKSMKVRADGKVVLEFNNGRDGLNPRTNLQGFEIAGKDKVFYPAQGTTEYDEDNWGAPIIVVWSEKVKKPVAVRYCFRNWMPGKEWNQRGLPLVPFRTDNWDK